VILGLIGNDLIGVDFFLPAPAVEVADFFDRPTWERPSLDLPYTAPVVEYDFSGETPGFSGEGSSFFIDLTPGFSGGLPEFTTWDPPATDSPTDGGTLTSVSAGGTVSVIEIEAERRDFYRVEVYTRAGVLVSRVPGWTRGRLIRTLDRASTLSLTVPIGEEGVADLVRPNLIWLRDRWGFVVDTFQIQRRKPRGSGDASYVDIEAQGRITELIGEVVQSYSTEDKISVASHVAALIALQLRDTPTPVGTIDDEIGVIETRFSCEDTNIHAALLQLQFTLPQDSRGRIYVDPQGRLNWRVAPGDQTEQVITRDLNVRSVEADIDYDSIVNRIYLYGEGNDPSTRLALTGYIDEDATEYTTDYLDDAASIATYGLRPYVKQDRRVKHQSTLLAMAQRILEEFADPPTTVTVELLDVAKADNALLGWRDIEVGGTYRVTDDDLGIESSIEIIKIETDLARPVPIRVELTNQTRSIADILNRFLDATVQPLDVDGDRYPTMGRNYSATDARNARAGDSRWQGDHAEMHDGADWQEIETNADPIWYTADSFAEFIDASTVAVTALGRIIAGDDNGKVYKINADGDEWIPFGSDVPVVLVLPAIPTDGMAEVYWTSLGGGTGDDQVWRAYANQAAWTPTQKFTAKSGAVV